MVSNEEDINESLRILLSTSPGERVMYPAYGCGLKKRVFEQIDESVMTALKDDIARAVLFSMWIWMTSSMAVCDSALIIPCERQITEVTSFIRSTLVKGPMCVFDVRI